MSFHFVSRQWEVQDLQDGTLVLFTQRDLDPMNVHLLVDELHELVLESGRPNLYLDFGQIHQMASIVIGKILALDTKLREVGGRVVLRNLDSSLHELFEAAKVSRVLELQTR